MKGADVYYKKDGITAFYSTGADLFIPPLCPPNEPGYTFVGYGPDPKADRNRLDWDYGDTGKSWNWETSDGEIYAIIAKFKERYLESKSYREKWVGSVDGVENALEIVLHIDSGSFDANLKLGTDRYFATDLDFNDGNEYVLKSIVGERKTVLIQIPFVFLPLIDGEDGQVQDEKYVRKIYSFYEKDTFTQGNYRFGHYETDGKANTGGVSEVDSNTTLTKNRIDIPKDIRVNNWNGIDRSDVVSSPEAISTVLPRNKVDLTDKLQEESLPIKDIDSLRDGVGVMPCMFATLPSSYQAFPAQYDKVGHVNFKTGFTSGYGKSPKESDGLIITRHDVNFLGRIAAQEQFFEQCGGYHTFDEEVCRALIDISNPKLCGYPKNAILDYYNPENNTLRQVRSLEDNNTWNFIEKGVDGVEHWKYADDNPVIRTYVNYSESIDLSETLFVETGVPDLFEVPYDSVLHMFAIGNIDCETLRRNSIEDVEMKTSYDSETETYETTDINGTFFTNGEAKSYLDIYSRNSTSFGSVMLGGFQTFLWIYNNPKKNRNHFEKLCPLAPFTGTVVLSKGDKIRISNSQIDIVSTNLSSYAKTVHDKIFTNEVLKRKYRVRFANLYKRTYVK